MNIYYHMISVMRKVGLIAGIIALGASGVLEASQGSIPQTIEPFGTMPPQYFHDNKFQITPPKASSGLPASVMVKSGPATIASNTVSLGGVGTLVMAANQPGNDHYAPAPEIIKTLVFTDGPLQLYPSTKSPSGRYLVATSLVSAGNITGVFLLHIVSPQTLKDLFPPIRIRDEFIENPPDYPTTADWNESEELVAIHNGNRVSSSVDLFRLEKDKLVPIELQISQKDWRRLIPDFIQAVSANHDAEWESPTTLKMHIAGTAVTGEKMADEQDFDCITTWRIEGNKAILTSFKKN